MNEERQDVVYHSTQSVKKNNAACTQIPTKIYFQDELSLEVVYWKDDDDGLVDFFSEKILFTDNNEFLQLIQKLNSDAQFKDYPIDRLLIGGPFKLLKELNCTIMDIPGLSDDSEKIVNCGLRMAKEADILFLVASFEKRHKLEAETFNAIEPLLSISIHQLPYLVLVNNFSRHGIPVGPVDDHNDILDHLLSKLQEVRGDGSNYLPSIDGSYRSQLFDHLSLKSNGFSFFGAASQKKEQIAQLKEIIIQAKKFKIDRILRTSILDLVCALYEIRKDLENTTRFKKLQLKSGQLDEKEFEKFVTEEWNLACEDLFNEMDLALEIDRKNSVKNVLTVHLIIQFVTEQTDYYVEKILDSSLKLICDNMKEINITYDKELFDEYYSKKEELYIETIDTTDDVKNKIANVYTAVQECKEKTSETSQNLVFDIFSRLYDALKSVTGEYLLYFEDNMEQFYSILKSRMKKKPGKKTVKHVLEQLKDLRNWQSRGENKKMLDMLFGRNLISLTEHTLASFKNKKWGKTAKSAIPVLKRKLTAWFNENEKEFKIDVDEEPLEQEFESLQMYTPTQWNLFSVSNVAINETDNEKTKLSKKRSVATAKKKPEKPPTSHLKNWTHVNISFETTPATEKVITVNFKVEDGKNVGFQINCYEDYKNDLENLFTDQTKQIFPIFVPSKNRAQHAKNILFSNELTGYSFLIYVVVEEKELLKYLDEFNKEDIYIQNKNKVIFVSIPGTDRGVGFARSCIKMIQEQIREHVPQFNFYWTIDDDVVRMNQFDAKRIKTGVMRKTFIGLALHSSQTAFTESLKQSDTRYTVDDGVNGDIISVIKLKSTLKTTTLTHRLGQCYSKLFKCVDNGDVKEFTNLATTFGISNENIEPCFKELIVTSARIQQNSIPESRMAITNSSCKTNYNFKGPDTHYRISSQLHACVLNFAPGLVGYNFLPWQYMLVDQDFVTKEKATFKKEDKTKRENRRKDVKVDLKEGKYSTMFEYRDYFDGEDKLFAHILELDNRFGYLMFFYDVKYGVQKKGGCFQFRAPGQKY